MSGTTISGVYLTGITLSNAATQNPATIATGATIKASGTALAGAAGTYWTIVNDGVVSGAIGVSLASSGNVSNNAGASVTGTAYGILLGSGGQSFVGTVTNAASASISGNQVGIIAGGGLSSDTTVVNSGSIAGYQAVFLREGQVTNAAGAHIQGTGVGVILLDGSVVNSGTIHAGSQGGYRAGIFFETADASFTNNASGVVDGQFAVEFLHGGTASNTGTIVGTAVGIENGDGGVPGSGGDTSITNGSSGLIEGTGPDGVGVYFVASGSLLNSGTISASESFGGRGVYLKAGGYIGNAAGAAISGYNSGVRVAGNGVVVNYGSISSTFASRRFEAGVGLSLIGGGSVINAASGSISGDNYGVEFSGGTTVLYNFGSIKNNDVTDGASVYLNGGGLVTNAVAGLIAGGQYGIEVADGPGFVLNSGTIANVNAGAGAGIAAKAAASINNYDTGLITGAEYGVALMGFGIVTNSGLIAGGVAGIHSTAVGHVTNAAGASIEGGSIGVVLAAGGTVINAGSITGGEGKALVFYGNAVGRVVVDAGAVFNGNVVGSGSASNTLELASSAAAGTISGLGTSFVNFGSVLVDGGARWELTGSNSLASGSTLTNNGTLSLSGATLADAGGIINNSRIELDPSTLSVASLSGTGMVTIDAGSTLAVAGAVSSGQDIVFDGSGAELDLLTPLQFSGTISGFADGDIIDLTSVTDVAGSHADMNTTTNVLTVTEGGQTYQFQFDKAEHFAGDFFRLVSQGSSTLIEENQIACYRRGTQIATEKGEEPVEMLAIGDLVLTASGALRPIKWIGRRSYGGRFIIGRRDILPICFKAGSLADGAPRRDLWISPHHAMFLDGVLIEAKDLVNRGHDRAG